MAHLDSPHWYDSICNKHFLPSIPCPACLASKDKDLFAIFTPGDQMALEWDRDLKVSDLLPVGFEYVLKKDEAKVGKRTVWSWDVEDFQHEIFSLEGADFPTFDAAADFFLRVLEADHLVKFPDFFNKAGSEFRLKDFPYCGDAFFFYHEARQKVYLFHEKAETLGRDFVKRKMGW